MENVEIHVAADGTATVSVDGREIEKILRIAFEADGTHPPIVSLVFSPSSIVVTGHPHLIASVGFEVPIGNERRIPEEERGTNRWLG